MVRFAFALALGALLAGAAAQAEEPPAPEQEPAAERPAASAEEGGFPSDLEKESYAIGYSFGSGLRKRKVEVAIGELLAGLRDGVTGGEGRLSEQEVVILTRKVQNAAMRRMREERAVLAAKNRAEGEAFLAANKERAGVVTLPSGLQYEVLREGDGPKPSPDDTVVVNYQGTLIDGTSFEPYRERVPVSLKGNMPAWREALPMMSVGSKWKIFASTDLAWGENEMAANIPPGATLIWEIELLSIEPRTEAAPGSGSAETEDAGTAEDRTTGTEAQG